MGQRHQPVHLLQPHPGIQSAGRLSVRPSALGRERPYPGTRPDSTLQQPVLGRTVPPLVSQHGGTLARQYRQEICQQRLPLLVGAQGTRKSTFCRSIVPPELRAYYTDSIDFSRKRDAELYLNRFALINIDEFDQISKTQQGFLKHILQKPVVNVRKPYANAVLEMRRYASFIATSNQKDLLTDPSGSRRFICIEVTEAIDTNRPIDYNQLYAQAMHELDHGERYWFDQSDERIMTENNHDFEQIPPEEQLFYHYFRVAGNDEEENGCRLPKY